MNVLSKPGGRAVGPRAFTRLRGLSLWNRDRGRGSCLTILDFPKAMRITWRQDGKATIGSRSRNFLLRCFPAGAGIFDRRSSPNGLRTRAHCPWRVIKILQGNLQNPDGLTDGN